MQSRRNGRSPGRKTDRLASMYLRATNPAYIQTKKMEEGWKDATKKKYWLTFTLIFIDVSSRVPLHSGSLLCLICNQKPPKRDCFYFTNIHLCSEGCNVAGRKSVKAVWQIGPAVVASFRSFVKRLRTWRGQKRARILLQLWKKRSQYFYKNLLNKLQFNCRPKHHQDPFMWLYCWSCWFSYFRVAECDDYFPYFVVRQKMEKRCQPVDSFLLSQ